MRNTHAAVAAVLVVLVAIVGSVNPAAADETVTLVNGVRLITDGNDLTIKGTPSGDVLTITYISPNSFSVNDQVVTGVSGRVRLLLGKGSDHVTVNAGEPNANQLIWQSLHIDAGPGDNYVSVSNLVTSGNAVYVGSHGTDTFLLSGSTIGSDVIAKLGSTPRFLNRTDVAAIVTASVAERIDIRQNEGDSRTTVSDSTTQHLRITTGRDSDAVIIDPYSLGPTPYISTGNGDDSVTIDHSRISLRQMPATLDALLRIRTGNGADSVQTIHDNATLPHLRQYRFNVKTGNGPDSLTIDYPPLPGDIFKLGRGPDGLTMCVPIDSHEGVITDFEYSYVHPGICDNGYDR